MDIFYNSVDISEFTNRSAALSEQEVLDIKEQLRITTSKIILFNGQLIERKGIVELLEGFHEYYKADNDVSLLIVGSGPARSDEERNVLRSKLAPEYELMERLRHSK